MIKAVDNNLDFYQPASHLASGSVIALLFYETVFG
jgi:hypothetical protein